MIKPKECIPGTPFWGAFMNGCRGAHEPTLGVILAPLHGGAGYEFRCYLQHRLNL